MISNIVFDMGGVLIRWTPELLMDQLPLSQEDRQLLLRDMYRTVEWAQSDAGILTHEQLRRTILYRLPARLHREANILIDWFDRYIIPMPGMGELVRELKENGYHIYLLSNASEMLRRYFPRIPGSEFFDGLLVSAEEGLTKPAHEIYERLYEKFGLEPRSCWFIDDLNTNVEGALRTGMGGTVFHGDVPALRRALAAAGIRCGA